VGDRHAHLWVLRDGTPAHAPPGRLAVGADGRLACHVCGRWFAHLGAHVRRHGWTAQQYRDAVGLPLHVPLCSRDLSAQIATRQKRAWDASQAVRDRFEPGHRMAQAGELSRLAAASRHRGAAGQTPDAVRESRAGRLAAGRATVARTRREQLDKIVSAAGVTDLPTLLRNRYEAGASLAQLASLTSLGRGRLRAELIASGARIRATGINQPASKHARAGVNDARTAERIGVPDIRAWLAEQRQAGVTLRELAERTGRSIPWVQSRLAQ